MSRPCLSPLLIILCLIHSSLHAQDSTQADQSLKSHMFGITYDRAFSQGLKTAPAHLTSIAYTNKYKVPITVRVNIAERFGTTGMQLEADAYPVINKKMYAYLNAGVADDILFPQYRTGFSLTRSLPAAFEAEGGFRYLHFNRSVWIYTASLGKYYKNYWFNLSTFLTPDKGHILQTYFLKARYYFNEKSYMMLMVGKGISPDDKRNNNQLAGVNKLQARSADLSFKIFIKKYNVISFSTGLLEQQDLEKVKQSQFNMTLGYQIIF